jgi:hypothetical protein
VTKAGAAGTSGRAGAAGRRLHQIVVDGRPVQMGAIWLKKMIPMAAFTRLAVLVAAATLAACTSSTVRPASQATPAPSPAARGSSTAPAATPSVPSAAASTVCRAPGVYLTAVRAGQHSGYDRVVFQFSGGLPAYHTAYVSSVLQDPKGTPVPLPGQAYLRVVFHGATGWCADPPHQTYPGPAVLSPYYPTLLMVSAAGDFEGYLSFGIGLAAQASYHVSRLASPDRVVIDVSHVQLGKFPGIWDITSWPQYWATQYAWLNGHQPWLSSPLLVVEVWARGRWHTTPAIQQTGPDTFRVTAPKTGKVYTVTGTRPVSTPGPWVITKIS